MMRENKSQIKKILCQTDFSDGWEDVICFTAKFAVKRGDKPDAGELNRRIQTAENKRS